MDIVNLWLQKNSAATIGNARFIPEIHPHYTNVVHNHTGVQGQVFSLIQKNNKREWQLKKFHCGMQPDRDYLIAVRTLVPKHNACIAAKKRLILKEEDLKDVDNGYFDDQFACWLQNTVLMPRVKGTSWGNVMKKLRRNKTQLSLAQRRDIATSLCTTICALEENGCAHRDLSSENMFVDLQEYVVYLVDWDSMFHGSLYFHKNTPAGTIGYMAPWVMKQDGACDARKSWRRKADRFALAILLAEILLVRENSPSYHNGTLFSQEMISMEIAKMADAMKELDSLSPQLSELFERTITVNAYEQCPEPLSWMKALTLLDAPNQNQHANLPVEDIPVREDLPVEKEIAAASLQDLDCEEATSATSERKYWLWLILLLICGASLGALYHYHLEVVSMATLSTSSPDAKATQQLAKASSAPAPLVSQNYTLKIRYFDNDLQLHVDGRPVVVNNENVAHVSLAQGKHHLAITFTGIRFMDNGLVKRTNPITQSQNLLFSGQKQIVVQIDRKQKKWYIVNDKPR